MASREDDIIFMTTAIQWMNQAFKGQHGEVARMVRALPEHFSNILQSYEDEIECLKRALPVDNDTQTNTLPAPVDSAEG